MRREVRDRIQRTWDERFSLKPREPMLSLTPSTLEDKGQTLLGRVPVASIDQWREMARWHLPHPPGIQFPLMAPISVDVEPALQMAPMSSPFPSPTRPPVSEQEYSPVPLLVSSVTLGHEPIGMDSDDEDAHPPCYMCTHSVRGTQDLLAQIAESDRQYRELLASRASTSTSEQAERGGSFSGGTSLACGPP